jgi:hypothetical protein
MSPGPIAANMQLCRKALPGLSSFLIMASKQIPEEPEDSEKVDSKIPESNKAHGGLG